MCVTTGRSHDPQAAAARLAQRHAGPATHVVYSHPCGCALMRETVAVTPGRMPHEGWREGSSGADRLASRNVDDRHIWERIGHLVTVLLSIWLANCPRKGPAQASATLIQGVVAAAAEPMYICFRDVKGATCVETCPCRSACRSRNRAWHGHTAVRGRRRTPSDSAPSCSCTGMPHRACSHGPVLILSLGSFVVAAPQLSSGVGPHGQRRQRTLDHQIIQERAHIHSTRRWRDTCILQSSLS